MTAPANVPNEKPWHRQLWPWLVIGPPAVSVIAGIALLCAALRSDDGLVTPDYYRSGLELSRQLTPEQAANCAVRDRECMSAIVKEAR